MIIRILKTAIIIQFVQLKYRHLHVIWNAVVIKVIKIISKNGTSGTHNSELAVWY